MPRGSGSERKHLAARVVVALVFRVALEEFVALLLLILTVLEVVFASVEEQRNVGLLERFEIGRKFEERRVVQDRGLEETLFGEYDAVLAAEAVACSAKLGDTLSLQALDGLEQGRGGLLGAVVREPFLEDLHASVQRIWRKGVSIEVINEVRLIIVAGEVVCDQL